MHNHKGQWQSYIATTNNLEYVLKADEKQNCYHTYEQAL